MFYCTDFVFYEILIFKEYGLRRHLVLPDVMVYR